MGNYANVSVGMTNQIAVNYSAEYLRLGQILFGAIDTFIHSMSYQ
jgi:uncharacterized pyridoxal phosphate-containing UPF0001 family protein